MHPPSASHAPQPLPTEEVDGSFLAGGPEVLSGLSCTASLLSDDLPAGTRSFYEALGGSFVASIPSGSGFIGYIGESRRATIL